MKKKTASSVCIVCAVYNVHVDNTRLNLHLGKLISIFSLAYASMHFHNSLKFNQKIWFMWEKIKIEKKATEIEIHWTEILIEMNKFKCT